jgi:hypothetical protein
MDPRFYRSKWDVEDLRQLLVRQTARSQLEKLRERLWQKRDRPPKSLAGLFCDEYTIGLLGARLGELRGGNGCARLPLAFANAIEA